MNEDLSTAYKMAISICILAAIFAIGQCLMVIGRNLWNRTTTQVTTSITSIQDTDAYFLASYEKPVPVANIWELVQRINYGAATTDNGNITNFSIKERNPTNPNDYILRATSVTDLDKYMHRKAQLSWAVDDSTGLYTMEVLLEG